MKSDQKFSRLLTGHIIGIIDSYGAVESQFTGDSVKFHAEVFGKVCHCRWRWNHRESIHWIADECRPSEEQYDAIQSHLTNKYGLEWWANGHHDIQDLLAKADRENED